VPDRDPGVGRKGMTDVRLAVVPRAAGESAGHPARPAWPVGHEGGLLYVKGEHDKGKG
jgi:hypothetical protein